MSRVPSIKYMDPDKFRTGGYLQEVNRQFFHPLGLSLDLHFHVDGYVTIGGILDCREDPEGLYFHEEDGDLTSAAQRVEAELAARTGPRHAALGYIIQPVARPHEMAKAEPVTTYVGIPMDTVE